MVGLVPEGLRRLESYDDEDPTASQHSPGLGQEPEGLLEVEVLQDILRQNPVERLVREGELLGLAHQDPVNSSPSAVGQTPGLDVDAHKPSGVRLLEEAIPAPDIDDSSTVKRVERPQGVVRRMKRCRARGRR